MNIDSKWIHFVERPRPGIKTTLWYVHANQGGNYLGEIRWHSPWRKYVFYPSETSLFEEDCLRDIANFVQSATTEHKAARIASQLEA